MKQEWYTCFRSLDGVRHGSLPLINSSRMARYCFWSCDCFPDPPWEQIAVLMFVNRGHKYFKTISVRPSLLHCPEVKAFPAFKNPRHWGWKEVRRIPHFFGFPFRDNRWWMYMPCVSLTVFIRCGGVERASVRCLEEAGRVTAIPSLAMVPLSGGEETHGAPTALEHTNNGSRPCLCGYLNTSEIYSFSLYLLSHNTNSHQQQGIWAAEWVCFYMN